MDGFPLHPRKLKPVILPQWGVSEQSEIAIDARLCVLRECPYWSISTMADGEEFGECAAKVFKAKIPMELLEDEIEYNSDPEPGAGGEDNPFQIRTRLVEESLRPECGVVHLEHKRRTLLPKHEDPLFIEPPS